MPDAPTTSLVRALDQYRLLEPAQLKEIAKLQETAANPQALGAELVRRRWLTSFQAQQVLQGRAANLILGPYVILQPLGDGGSGQVFKARHQKMGRLVALKVLRKDASRDAEAVQRFYREIEAASQLDHPNIIHAYEAGPIGPALALVMEYADGLDLERIVQRSGPLPVAQVCEYVRQAALGLQYAHERGLVHRDIKPSNLIVTHGPGTPPDGLVKILDFGLARLRYLPCGSTTADLTTAGGKSVTQGTPDYMSPEQALDFHGADVRSDLYSLGCTFYFLLAGKPPFAGESLAAKLLSHQQGTPPPLTRSDLPPGLLPILNRLLAKDPADRYQTPGELAEALAGLLRQLGSADGGVTHDGTSSSTCLGGTFLGPAVGHRAARTRHRKWALVTAGAGLVLAAALAPFYFSAFSDGRAGSTSSALPPNAEGTTRPMSTGPLVMDVVAANGKAHPTSTARLKEVCYADRVYVLTGLSSGLEGTVLIRTCCDDKHATNPSQVSFRLTAPATVYIAYDPRARKPPAWLADSAWQLTGESASFNVVKDLKVYARKFPAGSVTLGGNEAPGSDATYLIFVKPTP